MICSCYALLEPTQAACPQWHRDLAGDTLERTCIVFSCPHALWGLSGARNPVTATAQSGQERPGMWDQSV